MLKKITLSISFFLFVVLGFAQQDSNELSKMLEDFSKQKKGLNEVIKTDVSGLTLYDFITSKSCPPSFFKKNILV